MKDTLSPLRVFSGYGRAGRERESRDAGVIVCVSKTLSCYMSARAKAGFSRTRERIMHISSVDPLLSPENGRTTRVRGERERERIGGFGGCRAFSSRERERRNARPKGGLGDYAHVTSALGGDSRVAKARVWAYREALLPIVQDVWARALFFLGGGTRMGATGDVTLAPPPPPRRRRAHPS